MFPSRRDSVRGSSSASRTWATSRTRTGPARALGDHDRLEVGHGGHPAQGPEPLLAPLAREAPARDLHVLPLEGGLHLLDREPVRGEPARIHGDLDLALPLAHQRHGADVLHALERPLDPLVGQLRDLPRGPAAGDDEGEDGRRVEVELLDDRRLGALRELGEDRGDLLADVLRGPLDVAVEDERDEDLALPLDRRRAQLVDPADRVDDLLDPLGDLALDLLRARPRQARRDRHGRDVDLREDVEAEVPVGGEPQHHEGDDEHRREDGPADAEVDERHGATASRPAPRPVRRRGPRARPARRRRAGRARRWPPSRRA